MKAFMPRGSRYPVLTSDNGRLKPWRQDVAISALCAMKEAGLEVTDQAVEVCMTFYFGKPSSTPKRVIHKLTKPDADKCIRGILDAITGIVFHDDSQVTDINCSKRFGLPERAEISVQFVAAKAVA